MVMCIGNVNKCPVLNYNERLGFLRKLFAILIKVSRRCFSTFTNKQTNKQTEIEEMKKGKKSPMSYSKKLALSA